MRFLIILVIGLFLQGCAAQQSCKPIVKTDNTINVSTTLIKWKENNEITEQMMKEDDIEGWDIPIDQIKTVCIDEFRLNIHPYYFSKKDGIRLVKAFNAIQKKDIYGEESYGGYFSRVVVTLKSGEEIRIGYSPTCQLAYKGVYYYTSFQLEYYDVIRDLYKGKGSFPYVDWKTDYFDSLGGVGTGWINHIIVDPNKTINEARDLLYGMSKKEGQDYTFTDLLEKYHCELELNDVVETEDMRIKVIEIKDDYRVTAGRLNSKNSHTKVTNPI